jgi:hypothetical protein
MDYTFAYKIGHNPELSINEFIQLSKDENFELKGSLLLSNSDIDINIAGGLVFKAQIIKELNDLPKKIGYVTKLSKNTQNSLIKALKGKGAKKILITDKEPNIGQFKYVKNWYLEYNNEYLHILQNSDQELWNNLDMDLPAKDMKKGIINLKLARFMLNMTSYNHIIDPFAGLGRNAVAGWLLNKEFILSDIDPKCIDFIRQNTDYLIQVYGNTSKIINNYTCDAKDINILFDSDYAIVTEGHLTEAANYILSYNEAESRIEEVKKMWLEILEKWSSLDNFKEAIITIPFYLTRSKDIFWDIKKDLPKSFSHIPFYNSDYIFYNRKNTRIGHMVVKIIKK